MNNVHIFGIIFVVFGSNIKSAVAILNCILARQLCFEDPSCSAILEIIPRVCGPVPVACSTVTVTKCQAALRTLQAFPFFRPTCLCKEPGIDPDCNNFRDFLFDHPCGFVLKKEKDPYPIDALPTCNHALSVCQLERKCIKLFEDFKAHCKVRENKCRMEDRDQCHEAWTNLRLSPMFGCICPNNHMKRRCDRIFSMVNHNPCVDVILDVSSGTGSNSVHSISSPDDPPWLVAYPHFLYPPSHKEIPIALASHRPAIDHSQSFYSYNISIPEMGTGTNLEHKHRIDHAPRKHNNDEVRPQGETQTHTSRWRQDNRYESVRSMGMDDSYRQIIFDENMELIETPLIAPTSTHYTHHHHNSVNYPYNLTAIQGTATILDGLVIDTGGGTSDKQISGGHDTSSDTHNEVIRIHFQSTCHTALEACHDDTTCSQSLQPVLKHCEIHKCNRDACMESLQTFYRAPHEDLSLDVAFCLCKKTSNRHDVCMIAQDKLHPVCAQRPPDSFGAQTSNGQMFQPACHLVAEYCREDEECRVRLEHYEQACAVDSVTKKCAGRTSSCRSAMLGILGTPLRTSCACQGTDMQQLYECLGWQRLLWLNPCVVESQKDFHMKRLAELGFFTTRSTTTTTTVATTMRPITTKRTTTTTRMTLTKEVPRIIHYDLPTVATIEPNSMEQPDSIPETWVHKGNKPNGNTNKNNNSASEEQFLVFTMETTEVETTSTTAATTTTTTPATTVAPRNCVAQRPHLPDQLILEETSRRIYSPDDIECSELCTCSDSLTLSCHALCVPFKACRTALAFYSHESPAYQAYRGRCLCYSGSFICMRPPLGEYTLPGGVFLLMGYSATDEALLRPHTNLGVQDAVRSLQQYVLKHINNQTSCTLTLFNMTDENIIISARLPQPHDTKIGADELLRMEKEECKSVLESISQQINSQYSEIYAHGLLSIFKMAEVQVILPESNGAFKYDGNLIGTLLCLALVTSVRWMQSFGGLLRIPAAT